MLEVISHGDVTQLRFSTWRSRTIRYAVSAFVTRDVLVDSGFPDVRQALAGWLDASRVAGAIITHGHEDHGGNAELLAARGIPVQAAADTEALLRDPGRIGLYRQYTWGSYAPLALPLTPFAHPALALRPARGHSADHHVVWDAERGTLFGGDLFVGVKVRIAHHDEDLQAQVQALRTAAALEPTRLFDAHRGLIRNPAEQLRAKADWIEETMADIARRIREGWSDARIRREVLGGEELTGYASFGEYSRLNFVRYVRRQLEPAAAAAPSARGATAERQGQA